MKTRKILSTLLIVALMLTGIPVGAVEATALPAPELLNPSDESTSTVPPVFSWKAVNGATSYKFELSQRDDSLFVSSPLATITTKNLSATVNKHLADGTYYWRVTARGSYGVMDVPSEIRSITVTWDSVPEPVDPIDKQLIYPDDPLVLIWNPALGASEYEVEIGTSPTFANVVWKKRTHSSSISPYNENIRDFSYDTQYYWHVRSVAKGLDNKEIFGAWSNPGSFTIIWPYMPNLTGPVDLYKTKRNLELSWLPVPGAVEYELQISPNDDFSSSEYNHFVKTYSTSYTPEASLANEKFYWRVRGIDSRDNNGGWSERRSFFKEWSDLEHLAQPLYPGEGEHISSVSFEWSPVEDASHYQIQASKDMNTWASPFLVFDFTTNQTSFTPPKGTKIPANITLYWRVRPLDYASDGKTITGVWSNESLLLPMSRSFVRDFNVAMFESPVYGSTVNPPDLHWTNSLFADHYTVDLKGSGRSWSSTTDNLSATPESTSTVPSDITFNWWVTPCDVDGMLGFSSLFPWSFTVGSETTSTAVIELLAPANDSSFNVMPSFIWSAYKGASKYRIYYQKEGELGWGDLINFDSPYGNRYTAYTSYTPKKILNSGSYKWFVQSYDKDGLPVGNPSGIGTFVVTEPDPVTVTNKPENGSIINKTPTFTWNAVPKTAYYHIKVWADKDLSTLYREAKTVFTSWTPQDSYADNSVGTGYYWYVYAVDGSDRYSKLILSNVQSFEKHSTSPVLLSPLGGVDVDSRPILRWEPVYGAATYEVQVATDSNFGTSTVKLDRNVDGPNLNIGSNKSYSGRSLAEGTYYWHVRAKDKSGNYLTWSDTKSFKVVIPKPTLTEPEDGSSFNHSVLFTWQPVDGAKSYQVQVSNNSTYNSVTPVNVYGNSYTPTSLYAPGTYYWRVRIKDASGNTGPWSDTRTFNRTKQPAVTLLSPNDLAEPSNNLVFSWLPTQGAASYRVLVSANSAFNPLLEQKLTDLTSWAPWMTSPTYSTGTYYWKVAPVDSSNNDGEYSQTYSFTRGTPSQPPSDGGGGGGGEEEPAALSPPTNLRTTGEELDIVLTWSRITSDNLSGYRVYRSDSANGPWQRISYGLVTQATFTDESALAGKTYYYAVTAIDKTNKETTKSNIASGARVIVASETVIMFSDIPSSYWARSFILTLAGRNVLGGYADGTFKPERTLTRAEFAKIITVAKGWTLVRPATPSFKDVPKTHWAYQYIETAKQHGVINGYPGGLFKPGNSVMRAEICKMIVAGNKYAISSLGYTFNDLSSSHWAYSFIMTARDQGIVGGYVDGTFKPSGYTKRSEVAKIIFKTLGL